MGGSRRGSRGLVRFGRELFADGSPSDEAFDDVLSRYGTQGVTELTAVFAYYAMLVHICNTLGVLPDDDVFSH